MPVLARFGDWWRGLSQRERVLVAVLGALLVGATLVFGVVKPLQAARAQALADIRTYETLSARIRAAGTLTATKAPRREGAPAKVAGDAAAGLGLVVTPEAVPGGVRVAIADATYETLLAWIADLAATSDLRVRSLTIQRRPATGRVSASVELGA
ncbi:type II secretion system protein GspM [Sphingomonas hengshuiensis]|nr:type II secretion system protein GspM [Sphingomonas hengshuiensis]